MRPDLKVHWAVLKTVKSLIILETSGKLHSIPLEIIACILSIEVTFLTAGCRVKSLLPIPAVFTEKKNSLTAIHGNASAV